MLIKVRLLEIYESEGGGKRPNVLFVPLLAAGVGALAYAGKRLELFVAGAALANDSALAYAFAAASIAFLLLSVGWMGISVNHYTSGAEFNNPGVLNLAKNVKHYPDLTVEMEPKRGTFESASPAPVGIYIQVGQAREFVPGMTEEKLVRLVDHLEEHNYKLAYSLYFKRDPEDRNPWQRATVHQFRNWLIRKQWAEQGGNQTVVVRKEVAKGFEMARNRIMRGY